MDAAVFRAELKRLGVSQSAFARAADVPLRTVQSWAIGERKIPSTIGVLIENVEKLPLKEQFALMINDIPEGKLEIFLDICKMIRNLSKKIKNLEEQNAILTSNFANLSDLANLRSDFAHLRSEFNELAENNKKLGAKVLAYANESERRARSVIPFNN